MVEASALINVLHVDDDPDVGELTADLLEREATDLAVETVHSAEAALDRLADTEVDCIVSDYDMPGTDGLELLSMVRETCPDLPFLLFTGEGSEAVASEAISAGVTDYLQKEGGTSQYERLANRISTAVEKHRARGEAVESEARLQSIADHADDILWMYTADWEELLFVNAAYEEIWGRPISELRDYPPTFQRGVHPDDRPVTREAMDRLSAGEAIDIEFRVNAEEDFGRWVWVKGSPVFDESGEVVRVTGFARDITERRERQQELERYRRLVETVGDPMYVLDPSGNIEIANRAMLRALDADESAVVGAGIDEFLAEGDFERGTAVIREVLGDPDREWATFEMTAVTPAGVRIPAETNIAVIEEEGEYRGSVGVVRDISDRTAREAELERQNERLEEFASVVSHDLRNPLTVATGRLELAREEVESEHLESVSAALERMDELVGRLLELAREGREIGDLEPVVLAEVAERCWTNVETDETTLVVDTDRTVRCDPTRLRQLFENLFRNAVEYGGNEVVVGDISGGFYVADNGLGIPDEDRETVFEPGYSTSPTGTGFGLSIVRDIAEAHGWEVAVIGAETTGARFEFVGVESG